MKVTLASDARARGPRWLIQDLWPANGCGLIGGVPKSRKTWLALGIAKAAATGEPFLGKGVWDKVKVLYLAGEDSPGTVRERLGPASDRVHASFDQTRLDTREGLLDLSDAVGEIGAGLLVVDPLVRFHRAAEGNAGAMAELLAGLRALSNTHGCAVIVVHHMHKGGHGGQGLRGSSELHAWGDVNLFLDPRGGLEIEHRTAEGWETTVRLGASGLEVAHPLASGRRTMLTAAPVVVVLK